MKLEKTNLKLKDLGTAPFSIETAPEHIKLHSITLACGKRGSGKSFFLSNLLGWLEFDRIIIVSPTYESNYAQFKHLNIQDEDKLDPDQPNVVEQIISKVEAERDDLLEYRQKLKLYKELKKVCSNPDDLGEDKDTFHEYLSRDGLRFVPPQHRWGGNKPKIAVFVDDAQSTAIFRNRKFLNLATRHRHIGAMEGDEPSIGISMFLAIQNYTAQGGGLPRAIRGNATHMALWRTKNERELKLISEEFAGEVSPETFFKVYDYAMANGGEYPFLVVDLHKKKEHPSQFRVNYTSFITNIPSENDNKEKET